MKRDSWGSRLGFILAVAGSAIGLANIWRFPYLVGKYGGAAFILVYFACLLFIGFPVFLSEVLIGRASQTSPKGAFSKLGGPRWGNVGKLTIATGLLVSSFYSAVAGWILGYFFEALQGNLSGFTSATEVAVKFSSLREHPAWGVCFHAAFLASCLGVCYLGVRQGIERANKVMMPLLLLSLVFLVIKGLSLPGSYEGVKFVFTPDWSQLTPQAVLVALGQSFFTLSLGQGTMITYGSYFGKNENLLKACVPVILMDTVISLLASLAILTIVFAHGLVPSAGPGLIFHTLPWIFSQISGGWLIAIVFFLLVFLAALTSEVSALEPSIAYLIDEKGWNRHAATAFIGLFAFLLGIPSALSYSLLKETLIFDLPFFEFVEHLASGFLIPLGGFLAVVFVGWFWGFKKAFKELALGTGDFFNRFFWIKSYFWFCFKFSAPILMIIVFLHALGMI